MILVIAEVVKNSRSAVCSSKISKGDRLVVYLTTSPNSHYSERMSIFLIDESLDRARLATSMVNTPFLNLALTRS